jgi:pyruvate dehydrogenase E1 component alpha subunit
VLIREFEEACHQLYTQKRITGVYLHLYSGHEAVGVAAVANMQVGKDHVITAYRDHGLGLALGVHPGKLMAEMMGRRAGVSGGKGGSMHLASAEHNFWGGYAIVGGNLPLAAGIALEAQYNNTGAVHKRAEGYGVKDMERVDGQDIFKTYEVIKEAVDYARNKGPVLIEAMTYRYYGHGVSDKQYDSKLADELAQWKAEKDPIELFRAKLHSRYKNLDAEMNKIDEEVKQIVEDSVKFAEASPLPNTMDELMQNVYVED